MIHALTFATYAITLDGKPVLPHARAAVVDNRVLLPVRALGNALRADVSYRRFPGGIQRIHVHRPHHEGVITGRDSIRVVKGRAYAPLRLVASALGITAAYDGPARTIALVQGPFARESDPAQSDSSQAASLQAHAPTVIVGDAVRPPLTVTVSPVAHAQIHDPYPQISARFAGAASIDPRSLQVRIDDRDVSADASVIGDQVLLTPRTALMPGTHVVTISGRDTTGTAIAQQWSFDDTFAFSTAPPPQRSPVNAIWIDRWITPGTNAFDIYVQGAPGMTGYVGVDGVGGYFPLQVYTANEYVAHVFVPNGVNQPFARVAARLVYPNGTEHTIVLPQTINLSTPPLQPTIVVPPPSATPTPPSRHVPIRRSVDVPAPSPHPTQAPQQRRVLTTTTPTPSPTPAVAPANSPSPAPAPVRTRRPLIKRTPIPVPSPSPGLTLTRAARRVLQRGRASLHTARGRRSPRRRCAACRRAARANPRAFAHHRSR